ncbi:MAG: ABC transporter permease [Patescibacteria group bacterium]|mgnify:CR=1 FL=1
MKTRDSLHTAIAGIRHAKVRSFLTMLGIVIGIASVILLMSIGKSVQQLILNQIQGIGSNLVFVIPGATKGSRFEAPHSAIIKTLTKSDADALRKEPSIDGVAPQVNGQARIVYGNNDTSISFQGVSSDFFPVRDFGMLSGYAFSKADVESSNKVVVIGSKLAKTLFGDINPLDKLVRIKDVSFRIVGVLEEKGLGPMGVDQDNMVLIPITIAQRQILGIDYYNLITMKVKDFYEVEFAKSRIISVLRQNHRVDNPDKDDFTVQTQEDAVAMLSTITTLLTVFLTAIAAVSLVVGGIGIMNIMLVSVIERTREIGLRKAIGATSGDILQQFLWEAILLTFVGGITGIAVGASFVTLLYFVIPIFLPTGWVFSLPLQAILLAVGVSTLTGLIFGLYPARKASRKSPIEALRYE